MWIHFVDGEEGGLSRERKTGGDKGEVWVEGTIGCFTLSQSNRGFLRIEVSNDRK